MPHVAFVVAVAAGLFWSMDKICHANSNKGNNCSHDPLMTPRRTYQRASARFTVN